MMMKISLMRYLVLFCLVLLGRLCHANDDLYANAKHVTVMDSMETFMTKVLQSDSVWMIGFYKNEMTTAPKLAKTLEEVGTMLRGIFYVGVVDMSSPGGKEIAEMLKGGVDPDGKKPTILLFGDDKTKPMTRTPGNEKDTVEALAQELANAGSLTIQARAGRSSGQSSSSGGSSGSKASFVTLNQANFDEKVLNNPNVVAVAFTAPWCGHCKKLEPEWREAAGKLAHEGVTLGWVDATVDTELAGQYGVQGFPTIKVYPGGTPKKHSDAMDYHGDRSAAGIVQYLLKEVDRSGLVKEMPELTDEIVLKENCEGANRLCVLAALPHILDSGAEGRNNYRDLLNKVAKTFRGSAFSFMWFEGTSQPALEAAMELTFGFPALVALSMDRQAYAVLHGSFSEKQMTAFLHGITTGRQATTKLSAMPSIETVEPWDGKDGAPIEEEFDLSELFDEGEL